MSSFMSDLLSDKKAMWILGIGASLILILGFGFVLVFFNLYNERSNSPIATTDTALLITQAVQTIQADYTQQAMDTSGIPSDTPSPEMDISPTSEPSEQDTVLELIPTSTPSAIPPTETRVIPSLTPVPVVCNSAQFVRDVSVMDNTPFSPDTPFEKTWRIKNTGSCTWSQDYKLGFNSGNSMNAVQSVALPHRVVPNETVDITVPMKSPGITGFYRGDWLLISPEGVRFGTGSSGTGTLYVAIMVMNLTNPNLVYDFAANYCKADWNSGFGKLPCPGTSSGTEGFVTLLDMPKLENRQEDELTLWTHPQSAQKGWISGIYPEFNIQPGHRFIAWVGCLADSKGCNVTFRLDFFNTKTGVVKSLGVWSEVYDEKITEIDLDLSEHAGKSVQFYLTVEITGGDPARANAFWFVPGIIQGSVPQITPTPTETPTTTPTPTETPTVAP
jgi:hypothetical protein